MYIYICMYVCVYIYIYKYNLGTHISSSIYPQQQVPPMAWCILYETQEPTEWSKDSRFPMVPGMKPPGSWWITHHVLHEKTKAPKV